VGLKKFRATVKRRRSSRVISITRCYTKFAMLYHLDKVFLFSYSHMKPTRRKLCMLVFVAAGAFFGSHKQAACRKSTPTPLIDGSSFGQTSSITVGCLIGEVGIRCWGQGWGNKECNTIRAAQRECAGRNGI